MRMHLLVIRVVQNSFLNCEWLEFQLDWIEVVAWARPYFL